MIAARMRQMGVTGLPRNYEIFYAVETGTSEELSREFGQLGDRPSQRALDELSRKYFTSNNRDQIVQSAQEQVSESTTDILALMQREQNSIEKFCTILDKTSGGLEGPNALSRDVLQKVVGIMAAATHTTLEQGRTISRAMQEKTAELDEMKTKLARYKRLAETDPLTRVWNRRAFDRRMAEIYNDGREVMFNALILADIDGFKAFNDRHGHPVGDKVLQMVAHLISQKSGQCGFVARTGGEEFAIIVDGKSEDGVYELAEHARTAIAQAEFSIGPTAQQFGPLSISLGICMASEASDAEDLYAKADRALYASKSDGRNRTSRFSKITKGGFAKNWLLYKGE
ncbi:Diguanylate cyclase [Nitratireductor basaltis]|uniref:diguanylate cyclase n=2 Tax=Nitratireductor basaltis TaxID=472175 RepID=A0A084UBH5_9HYPH|nr:Diguanylate cyclase [Nitratireductor basaltis]